jgi:nucleotide-binding universal stress UspA family protein
MYEKILVSIDDSDTTGAVVNEVISIGMARRDHVFTLLQVVREVENIGDGAGEATELLHGARQRLLEHEIQSTTVLRRGDPADEICRYAEDEQVDLVIVGSKDRGLLEKLFISDVSQKVVRNAPSHVLVVK